MAWVSRFKHDVFISYARVDDATVDQDPSGGWVAKFCKHLEVALSKKIGRLDTVRIWRDTRQIQGNQLFDQTIGEALAASAVFVALTSRGYLESEYCRQELHGFHDKAQRDGIGLTVGDEYRIFNVRITDVPREQWPEEYGRTSGWPMYEEPDGGYEGDPATPGSEYFGRSLRALAQAIYGTLLHLQSREPLAETNTGADAGRRIAIFLADTSDTLRSLKKRVNTELASLADIEILGSVPPPFEATEHDERVRGLIEVADLSIHLIDALPGREIPGAPDGYFPRRQIEIAKRHGKRQIIWAPKDLDFGSIEEPGYRAFLEELENGTPEERRAEFQRGLASDVPRQIVDKIGELRSRSSAPCSDTAAAVLLDTHFKDQLYALELSQYLLRHNIQPYINPQEDDPRRNVEVFAQRLKQTAYLIFFFGAVADEWLRARLAVALQIAISEDCPLRGCGVYLAPPRTADTPSRMRLPVISVEWMDHTQGFDPAAVDRFFQKAQISGGFPGRA